MKTKLHNLQRSPKLVLMGMAVFLLYILSYQVGTRKTWDLFSNCREMENDLSRLHQIESQPGSLEKRLDILEHQIGFSNLPETDIRQNILDRLSILNSSYGFTIIDIPPAYIYQKQDYQVIINTFLFEGKYDQLLHLIHCLETANDIPRIISSKFSVQKDPLLKTSRLTLTIYFQTVKKKSYGT